MLQPRPAHVSPSSVIPEPDERRLLLRPIEAARELAISPRKLWELTSIGQVPVVRIGRSLRYSREALRLWIANRQRPQP
jgi:predicted DNA-binding transcriptional regulator AlpA